MVGQKGRSGRPPKPLAVLKAEGNRGHRAKLDQMAEPQSKGQPVMPPTLTKPQEALWYEVLRTVPADVLNRCDVALLEILVTSWQRLRQCNAAIETTGLIVKSSQGAVVNPLIKIAHASAAIVQRACAELGMSPVSRARLMAFSPDDGEDQTFIDFIYGDDSEMWVSEPPTKPISKRRGNGNKLN
ncbi:phage terminase, small subunit, putative, P27 family [Phyllobacterium sp. CL33Tsu]|uniref:phage terminase small subunit P27 family n=1 Tax=Phyllobacterium sp. CL33Tsu TaxID=1798191 RepID=UPI0008F0B99A|nr:phage terminase small subunit P27 family [Phyllobacterium sp. CL33Tsu]SFJ31745.1 phage terminase, small subunit, putative, P27 family [Phyllobacterium sp. CL33Tsu]